MRILTHIKGLKVWAWLLLMGMATTSCDDILEEEKEDCSVGYLVKFKYDMNMKFADAFAHEVNSVSLYAFGPDGKLAYRKTEKGDILAQKGYAMNIEIVPDEYELVAWAGLDDGESFHVPEMQIGVSTREDLYCKMNRQRTADGKAYIDKDLKPLFHGRTQHTFHGRAYHEEETVISLTKNTNVVRVLLQHLSGEKVDVNRFRFMIEDANGDMDYTNALMEGNERLTYHPWSISQGTAGTAEDETTTVSVALAEMTVGRLVTGNKPVLSVFNEVGDKVASIPLIDYALLVKGNYNRDMTDQEYLDRQDEYNLTFFLDKNDEWYSSSIIINGWKLVLNNAEL